MKKICLLLAFAVLPFAGFCWDGIGHSTAGAVAYYYMKNNNPAAVAKVIAILKQHPWYSTPRWNDKLAGLTGEQKDVALFMLASTYPDDARDNPELGGGLMKKWHYVDYPYVPAGQTVTGTQPESPNAEEKINELLGSVGKQNNVAQQAVDLCWLFHLVEDIHMPLHTVSLFDNNHPKGDKGGNDTYLVFASSTSPVKLHSYWDGLVKGSFANAPEHAQELLKENKYKEANLKELKADPEVKDWILKESFVMAKENVYGNGTVTGTKENPSHVDDAYSNMAKELGERRVVVSGIRLAKKLSVLFG